MRAHVRTHDLNLREGELPPAGEKVQNMAATSTSYDPRNTSAAGVSKQRTRERGLQTHSGHAA